MSVFRLFRTRRDFGLGRFLRSSPQQEVVLIHRDRFSKVTADTVEVVLKVIADLRLVSEDDGFVELGVLSPSLTEAFFADLTVQAQDRKFVLRAARWDTYEKTVVVRLEQHDGTSQEMTVAQVYQLLR